MKIQKDVYLKLIHTIPGSPIEEGGILGGINQVVTHCEFDNNGKGYGTYTPDVLYLNRRIEEWAKAGISFYGIFHSHYPEIDILSNGDKRYITSVMDVMENGNASLYFPVIIPGSHITVYRAYKDITGVHIVCDELEII